ncbi:hypothetical protein VMCG_08451 [Cytospora schulzeri]|uniref:Uncharacterized protein n=1 Tax=Cytospora schulzeri TaxID=448051 RepID=A0A423VWT0_9PEZI|nr:hypothetical protein VMCG_08451 [Valsa malicola]
MYAHELDAYNRRPTSSSFSSSDGHCITTAAESAQRANSGPGIINSAGENDNNTPRSTSSSRLAMRTTALGIHGSRWLGGLSADTRGESGRLGVDPVSRHRPLYKLRSADRRWQRRPEDNVEAWDELTTFLRTVTPPPSNYMSVPTELYSPTTISSRSSIKRRGSRKKKGPWTRCLMFLKGRSKLKKSARKTSVRASSPPATRTTSRKHRRPPQIKLPDTAVSGRTVDGHRHIAISIPIEHDHLTPGPRYGFHRASRRPNSLPPVDMSPAMHINTNVRPMSAFANEPRIGTPLGSVAEERGSLPSRPRTRDSQRGQEGIASRHTFGSAQGEVSSPNAESMSPPRVPRRISDRYDTPSHGRPSTSQTSEDLRELAHMKALAALSRPQTAPRPLSSQSAYSFRSFATPSPSPRVHYPLRKASLHFGPSNNDQPQARGVSDRRGRVLHSRDSSRDKYTMQESIFSERSFLESMEAVESISETESGVITKGMQARGFPLPTGIVQAATAPENSFEAHGGYWSENGENHGRQSDLTIAYGKRNSGQEIHRGIGQESAKVPIWQRRGSGAAVVANPEMKTVEAHAPRKSQLRESVEVVLETSTEASWLDRMSESSEEEDEDDPKDTGNNLGNRPEPKGKEKERTPENTPMLKVSGEAKELRGTAKKSPGSLPSPKHRGEGEKRGKEIPVSREQRIAELRQKLEAPGTEPKDLVWRREPSISSDGSSDEGHSADEGTAADNTTSTYVPAAAESKPNSLETTPGRFSLSAVITVADIKPSSLRAASPELGITRQESLALSTSSSATMATVVQASPIPPYQSPGSATPAHSPPSSPISSSPVSSVEAQHRETPLQHPSYKRLNSSYLQTPKSGPHSHVSTGWRSPVIEHSASRPRTSSKGPTSSAFYSERHTQEEEHAEPSTPTMKTPHAEQSGPYEAEAQDEKKVQDMEKRLTKLERYREHWVASMIPLLTDMGQALGKLTTSNGKGGKGKEVDDASPRIERHSRRPNATNSDGRRPRMWRRESAASEDAEFKNTNPPANGDQQDDLDSDEFIMRHPAHARTGRSRAGTNTSERRSRRLHPLDEAARWGGPGLDDDHDDDVYDDFADDERRARSESGRRHHHHHRRKGRTSSVPLPPGLPLPMGLLREEAADRLGERLGRYDDGRVDARMRSISLGPRAASGVDGGGSLAGLRGRRGRGLDAYAAGAAADVSSGMETLEGLMEELQVLGGRLGMGRFDAGHGDGHGEGHGHGVREAPRSVVGFGAFR